ncbi:MAG: ABC transporter ATP-binding protein [Planctomycetes bacterium]|nr:ABC transporter ATP-binding protein [Planctomycetota bacterium]
MNEEMNRIRIDKVTRWYGQVIGLNNISLDIGPGITGLLGPNGAGKTTLMKLVTGQIHPNQGHVLVGGENPFTGLQSKQRTGYLPEMDVLPDHRTGEGFLRNCALLRGYSPKESKRIVQEALSQVGLSEAAGKLTMAYSKGMRQRLKLAQAIIHDPDFLVLDEPLTGLDPVGRREVIDRVKEYGRKGCTVLVSSHVLHEIELMTDQVVLIVRGKVLAEGTIEHIRSLIDSHPHAVDLKTNRPLELAVELLKRGCVTNVNLEDGEDRLIIQTRAPERFYDTLALLVVEEGFEVERFHSLDNNLQAVFDYLVK